MLKDTNTYNANNTKLPEAKISKCPVHYNMQKVAVKT